jgi:hypothetical protein
MKGIYITKEGKKEIEDKIVELETNIKQFKSIMPTYDTVASNTQLFVFKEILSSATILPVENNMSYVKSYDFVDEFDIEYPNGVIIQPTNK